MIVGTELTPSLLVYARHQTILRISEHWTTETQPVPAICFLLTNLCGWSARWLGSRHDANST